MSKLIKSKLCGRGNTCCPEVEQTSESNFTITDDFGGKVSLTREEFFMLQDVINQAKHQFYFKKNTTK